MVISYFAFQVDLNVLETLRTNLSKFHGNFLLQYISPGVRSKEATYKVIKVVLSTVDLALCPFKYAPSHSLFKYLKGTFNFQ